MMKRISATSNTDSEGYAAYLGAISTSRWRRWLNVQAPYRWNIRRLVHGLVLDIGAGVGRNLLHLDGHGVGIDHNAAAVAYMRSRGLQAFMPEEFLASTFAVDSQFDALLFAHVLEHLTLSQAAGLITEYLPYLRPNGMIVVIAPQERGYRSDPSHVTFIDGPKIEAIFDQLGLDCTASESFPFPRWMGKWFTYNEFVMVASKRI